MEEVEKQSTLKDRATWKRILYMLLFAFIYSIAEIVVTAVVVLQILFRLFTGQPNDRLLAFGRQVSDYIYQILMFLTFNAEEKPFPFSNWPD
ncbi:MAG: DUF4389 domain-containing protein [Thiotrichales bacterium]